MACEPHNSHSSMCGCDNSINDGNGSCSHCNCMLVLFFLCFKDIGYESSCNAHQTLIHIKILPDLAKLHLFFSTFLPEDSELEFTCFCFVKSTSCSVSLTHCARASREQPYMMVDGDSSNEPKPHLIFTYGTLKKGFPNHALMQDLIGKDDAVLVGSYITHHPYPLVCGPYGIPYLINIPGSGHRVKGELYSVSSRGLERLDELEGIRIGHYERLPVQTVDGAVSVDAEAYFAHSSFGEGLWRKKGQVGISEYEKKDAREYVRMQDRPSGSCVLDALISFVSSAGN